MRGYKGMNGDMTCRGMQFEVGKSFRVEGKIEICKRGFHFCKFLIDVFRFYGHHSGCRYFVVEASGIIKSGDNGRKYVTDHLKIIRELSEKEVNRAVYGCADGCGNGNCEGMGSGDGFSRGYGFGNGNGDGFYSGNGNGEGFGNGDLYGDIYVYGDGNGCGDGCGDGNGCGDGCGDGHNDNIIFLWDCCK